MKKIFSQISLLSLLLLMGSHVAAGVYKWVDEDGQVHFGSRPPTDTQSSEVKIRKQPVTPPQNPVDRVQKQNRFLEQRQRERAQRKEQAAKKRRQSEQMERRCNYSKNKLQEYRDHGSLYERLPNNKRRYLSDKEREQEIAKARREVERWCK